MANITITKETAEKLYDLFQNVETADAHYQRCQSDNFRLHVKAVYQNAGVSGAFEELHQQIEAAQEDDAPRSAKTARSRVMSKV